MFRVDVLFAGGSFLHGFVFVEWVGPLVAVCVAGLYQVHFVLVEELLEGYCKVCGIFVLVSRRAVHGSVHAYDDPVDVGVASCSVQVFLEEGELF